MTFLLRVAVSCDKTRMLFGECFEDNATVQNVENEALFSLTKTILINFYWFGVKYNPDLSLKFCFITWLAHSV